jgi:hypothetical protein
LTSSYSSYFLVVHGGRQFSHTLIITLNSNGIYSQDDTVEEHTLTPRQEELLFTIKDPMASDYFSQYLSHTPDNKAGLNALELWKDIERYKLLPDKELRVHHTHH